MTLFFTSFSLSLSLIWNAWLLLPGSRFRFYFRRVLCFRWSETEEEAGPVSQWKVSHCSQYGARRVSRISRHSVRQRDINISNIRKNILFFLLQFFVVEILMGNLSREESDISSQYGRSSPNTESASPELKNTVVRLNSPSFSSNFLTVSFARKQENISLRVLPSGQGTWGEKIGTENKKKDLKWGEGNQYIRSVPRRIFWSHSTLSHNTNSREHHNFIEEGEFFIFICVVLSINWAVVFERNQILESL